MNEREIKLKIIEQSDSIAKSIKKGKDVEIIKTSDGIAIKEISKKKISIAKFWCIQAGIHITQAGVLLLFLKGGLLSLCRVKNYLQR